jgi:hypothetical protein
MVHQSDLVQRAGRAIEYRTRLQNRFKGWNFMLLNAVLNFAVEQNVVSVYTPTADLALRNTDPSRNVGAELFERVYDRQIQQVFKVRRVGDWWNLNVEQNRDLVIRAETKLEHLAAEKVICVCHDIEQGLGHLDSDPDFAALAEKTSPVSLAEMLRIEREMGVRATYNVVGQLFPIVREQIESEGHCLAFHSYNHRSADEENQIERCRSIDYRLKGYRPPQSKMTRELSEENLCFHNFEWLASSTHSLGFNTPRMRKGLVKIPIDFDDYEFYRDRLSWDVWEARALETIEKSDFIAFSLHDCYAPFWLPHYRSFLDKVRGLGTLKTMNEVLNAVVRSHAQ